MKKIIAIILAVELCICLLPISSFAEYRDDYYPSNEEFLNAQYAKENCIINETISSNSAKLFKIKIKSGDQIVFHFENFDPEYFAYALYEKNGQETSQLSYTNGMITASETETDFYTAKIYFDGDPVLYCAVINESNNENLNNIKYRRIGDVAITFSSSQGGTVFDGEQLLLDSQIIVKESKGNTEYDENYIMPVSKKGFQFINFTFDNKIINLKKVTPLGFIVPKNTKFDDRTIHVNYIKLNSEERAIQNVKITNLIGCGGPSSAKLQWSDDGTVKLDGYEVVVYQMNNPLNYTEIITSNKMEDVSTLWKSDESDGSSGSHKTCVCKVRGYKQFNDIKVYTKWAKIGVIPK